jgi:hypothetical protein
MLACQPNDFRNADVAGAGARLVLSLAPKVTVFPHGSTCRTEAGACSQPDPSDAEDLAFRTALHPNASAGYGSSIRALANDVVIRRRLNNAQSKPGKGATRGKITEFSRKSRTRLALFAGNIAPLPAMLGLTYPEDFPTDGKMVKRHLAAFRKCLMRKGIGGCWVFEWQERGAPHVHVAITRCVSKVELSQLKADWHRITQTSDSHHEYRGCWVQSLHSKGGLRSYWCKYGAKLEQKQVPEGFENVGRLWGRFGDVPIIELASEVGTRADVAPVIRAAVNLVNAKRRDKRAKLRAKGKRAPSWLLPVKDKGVAGFVLWGEGVSVAALIARLSSPQAAPERPFARLEQHVHRLACTSAPKRAPVKVPPRVNLPPVPLLDMPFPVPSVPRTAPVVPVWA